MTTFKPNDLQKKLGSVFNAVQKDGLVLIDSRSRPDMLLILKSKVDEMERRISALEELADDFDLLEYLEIKIALSNKEK